MPLCGQAETQPKTKLLHLAFDFNLKIIRLNLVLELLPSSRNFGYWFCGIASDVHWALSAFCYLCVAPSKAHDLLTCRCSNVQL